MKICALVRRAAYILIIVKSCSEYPETGNHKTKQKIASQIFFFRKTIHYSIHLEESKKKKLLNL